LYAAVDRVVVTVTHRVGEFLNDPTAAVEQSTGRDDVQLRADIGTSVALMILVIAGVLVLVFM
jgi:hypothetical protein